MVTERLNVLLTMQAGQYKREAREASTATRNISTSAQQTGTATGRLDRQIGGLGITMRQAFTGAAAAGAVKFMKDSVGAATDLQESINAVNVVFGDAAEGINALGENSADSFGLAQSSFNEFAVRFSAFGEQIAEAGNRDVVGVVDEMTTRVADFASVHNVSLERAAEVAQSTLAGETEVFRRFGGDVSAATVEAKALEEGIIESGEAISEQDKILARYMLFMEQTADTAGDFKNTQGDLANATRTMQASFEDFQASLGTLAIPWLEQVVGLGSDLVGIFGALVDPLADLVGGMDKLGEVAFSIATFGLGPVASQLNDWISGSEEAESATRKFRFEMEAQHKAAMGVRESTWDASEAMYEARDAAMAARPEVHGLADASERGADEQDDLADAADNVTRAMRAQLDFIRAQRDPMFALQDAASRAAEAQQALADAEPGSEEHREALREMAEALLDVRAAQVDVVEAGGQTREEFIKQQTELGMTRDDAEALADQFDDLESFHFTPKEISISTRVSGPGSPTIGSFFGAANIGRQHGGPVRAGHPYMVGEAGPEMFIPNQDGSIASNGDTDRLIAALQGLGNGPSITLNGVSENVARDAQRGLLLAGVTRRAEVGIR